MKFGPVRVGEAEGAILAHAVKQGDLVLKKGTILDESALARLRAAGVDMVVAARPEADDVGEDAAALALAQAMAGSGIRVDRPATGRANLFVEAGGVLHIDAAAIDAINAMDEAITVATLPVLKPVVAGEMVGTVKIIPFAVPRSLLARAMPRAPALSLSPYGAKRVAVVSTLLPGLKASVVDKTLKVLKDRLAPSGAQLAVDRRTEHDVTALADVLNMPDVRAADLIIVFGASAITDRADVIPDAIGAVGGHVTHFGMPVDPGNLLLIGDLGGKPVIGAPGCARSPRENGFDWVLARLLADVPVTRADIQRMGVGGLLMEIVSRPQPRALDALPAPPPARPHAGPVEIILLAAGRSARMGGPNKLLSEYRGKALVRHVAEAARAAAIGPVTVVLGHEADRVRAALGGLDLRFVDNRDYSAGMSASLKAGIAALGPECGAAIILLGDMPLVSPAVIRRLAAVHAEAPEALAVAPTFLGQRGNPVLVARGLFPAVSALSGDIGARRLIEAAEGQGIEVAVDDPGILRDFDTPEALETLVRG